MDIREEPKKSEMIKAVNSDKKSDIYQMVIFTIVVLVVLLVGAIKPTIVTIFRIINEIDEKQDVKAGLETKYNNLSSLQTEFTRIEDDYRDLQLLFPDNGDFSLVLSNIEHIGQRNGFVVKTISFYDKPKNVQSKNDSVSKDLDVLEPWYVSISLQGKLENLRKLLEDFEQLPMLPTIVSVSYSARSTNDDGTLNISIQLELYKVKQDDFY